MIIGTSGVWAGNIPLSPQVKQAGKLTIASGLDYAPMQYVDAQGHPAGMNVELAQAVAKVLGTKLDIVTIPFKSQIPALVSGRVDIGWAGYTVLPERLKQVDFVGFMKAGTVVVVLPENKGKFSKKNDICGKTVAVASGNAADGVADQLNKDCVAAGLSAVKKEIFPDQKDTIQAVLTGRVDARLDDATAAGYYEATTKGKNVIVGEAMDPAPLGLAVRKGDSATAQMLAAAFDVLIADGTYKTVLKKYGMNTAAVTKAVVYTDASQLKK
jgi:polar amino acid transport system substrate-binding protein